LSARSRIQQAIATGKRERARNMTAKGRGHHSGFVPLLKRPGNHDHSSHSGSFPRAMAWMNTVNGKTHMLMKTALMMAVLILMRLSAYFSCALAVRS
jgi:hypothetical protein